MIKQILSTQEITQRLIQGTPKSTLAFGEKFPELESGIQTPLGSTCCSVPPGSCLSQPSGPSRHRAHGAKHWHRGLLSHSWPLLGHWSGMPLFTQKSSFKDKKMSRGTASQASLLEQSHYLKTLPILGSRLPAQPCHPCCPGDGRRPPGKAAAPLRRGRLCPAGLSPGSPP